ncbi:MAG: hypothetical protein ACRDSP_25040 [Pseudonocardiaceae bacterium]
MPDCYSVYDWSRSYLLPDHVVTNIPLRGSDGEPGAYNNARGLLVEVCLATGARPVALHYTETLSPPDGGLTRIGPGRCWSARPAGTRCVGRAPKRGRSASTTHTWPPRTAAFLPHRPGRAGSSPVGYGPCLRLIFR